MNGSTNSGRRSIRIPPVDNLPEFVDLRSQDDVKLQTDPAPSNIFEQPAPLTSGRRTGSIGANPIIALGNIQREIAAMESVVKELPRSHANFENRLRGLIARCSSLARQARELLEDEARRQEAEL